MIASLLLVPVLALGALGARTPVAVEGIEGLQVDSLSRAQFLDAFRGTFQQSDFNMEELQRGKWEGGTALLNRFEPVYDSPDSDGWSLRVIVELPPIVSFERHQTNGRSTQTVRKSDPKRRTSRRLAVIVGTRSPWDRANEIEPEWTQAGIVFPVAEAPPQNSWYAPSPWGYAFPWAEAGRIAALVALEALHRRDGELRNNARLDIAPAMRIAASQ